MQHILDISGDSRITGPTDEQIRQAVLNLDTRKGEAFVILSPSNDDNTYIQSSGDPRIGFDLEYQEDDTKNHFRAAGNFDAERIITTLIAYRNGDEHWRSSNKWERITW